MWMRSWGWKGEGRTIRRNPERLECARSWNYLFSRRGLGSVALCAAFLLLAGCEKEAPVQAIGSDPTLVVHYIPDIIRQSSQQPALFMVKAMDPQGLNDLSGVTVSITQNSTTNLTEDMRDDGLGGDILAGDGVFTFSLVPRLTTLEVGQIKATFHAMDTDGHQSDDVEEVANVVEGGDGTVPNIIEVVLEDSIEIISDTLLTLEVIVDDADGDDDSVVLMAYSSSSTTPILSDTLVPGVVTGAYELLFSTTIFSEINSDYFFRVQAADQQGNQSLPYVSRIHVERFTPNDPPVIVSVSAPDTLSRSSGNFLVTAELSDPQGLNDIDRVLLNSFLPDGTPSSSNPFELFDDGIQGSDVVANDGIYSVRFVGIETAALGTYRFEIQATDNSGEQSNSVTHFLVVIP